MPTSVKKRFVVVFSAVYMQQGKYVAAVIIKGIRNPF